jgi:hypothetical protein
MLGVSVGVAAGVVFAALAGARRTSSAFDRFTDSSHAADLIVGIKNGAEAERLIGLSGVADVVHLGVLSSPPVFHISDGRLTAFPTEVTFGVSDGRYFADVERPRLAEGRRWEDGAAEAVVNPAFVARTGLDVGDRLQVVAIPDEVIRRFHQFEEVQAAYEADRSIGRTTEVTIVGRVVRAADVARDTASAPGYIVVDRDTAATILGASIALTPVFEEGGHPVAVVLEEGADPDTVVRAAAPSEVATLDDTRAAVAVAVRPFVIAILLFAALAALGALAAIGGSLARHAVADARDAPLLFSLGAGRLQLAAIAAGRVGIVGAVGVVTALTVAISLSPIFPLGPVAAIEPNPGVAIDLVVLAPGAAVLLAAVLTVGLVAGRRHPGRQVRSAAPGWLSRLLTPRLPVSGAIGVWMAFPPRGRARTLMRATLVPVAVAFVSGAVVAVFTASVDDLFEHPRRHGWNWDLAVTCQQGYCDIPVTVADEIAATVGVETWTRLSFGRLDVDGIEIPVVGAGFGHGVTDVFTVVDGHPPASAEEIVLGGSTMRDLHVGVGDQLRLGGGGPTTRVVGRAVFSGLGPSDVARPSLGNGAGMTTEGLLNLEDETDLVDAVVLRVDGDPTPVADSLRHLMPNSTVLATQRPSALAAWPQLRRLPIVLSLLLAVLGIASLAHGVATSTRLHRKDLAVMGALGLRVRRVAHAVFWQTLALFSFALALSVPLGILLGVRAWHVLTKQLDLDSTAVVAPVTLGAGALTATTAVITVAILVARRATRRPAGRQLHAD